MFPADPARKRTALFIALYGCFLLVFVATPLWNWFPGQAVKMALVAGISLSGYAWAFWSAEKLKLESVRATWGSALIAGGVVLILNFKTVQSGIPWRGDEDHHMRATWALAQWMPHLLPVAAALAAAVAWAWFKAWPLRNWRTPFLAVLLALVVFLLARRLHFDYYPALRYPYFLRYLSAPPLALYAKLSHATPPEFLFRILPMISAAAVVWLCGRFENRPPLWARIAWPVYLASIPLLWYYSSILYLELPAVFLMTAVCLKAEKLLQAESEPPWAWLALIFVGFVKETTLPFLLAFIVCHAVAGYLRNRKSGTAWIRAEAKTAFCIAWPLVLYLALRFKLGNARSYGLEWGHLFSPEVLKTISKAWMLQMGPLVILATGGLLILWRRRQGVATLFLLLSMAGPVLVHTLDRAEYAGLSRFNLMLLPGLLALAFHCLSWLLQKPGWLAATLACFIAANAWISPIHADGSKVPKWGNYLCDEGEHDYPYREVFRWVDTHAPGKSFKLTGSDYPYWTDFYHPVASSLQVDAMPKPQDEAAALDSVLAASARQGFDLVLFQVRGEGLPAWNSPAYEGRVFSNQAHSLVLFTAKP